MTIFGPRTQKGQFWVLGVVGGGGMSPRTGNGGVAGAQQGVTATLLNLVEVDLPAAKAALHRAKGVLFGVPTLVADAPEPIWELALSLNSYTCKVCTGAGGGGLRVGVAGLCEKGGQTVPPSDTLPCNTFVVRHQ